MKWLVVAAVAAVVAWVVWDREFSREAKIERAYASCMKQFGGVPETKSATPAAPFTGVMLTTVGAVVSGVDESEVVKPLVNVAIVCAARSRRPPTATVYDVDGDSGDAGANVNVT